MRLRRRRDLVPVLVGWRAEPGAVQRVLEREAVPAAVTDGGGGWALARLLLEGTGLEEPLLEPRGRTTVDLVDDLARSLGSPGVACLPGPSGARLVLACGGDAHPTGATVPPLGGQEQPDRTEWAGVLRVLDALPALGQVLEAASPGPVRTPETAEHAGDRRGSAVARALGLPVPLLDPELLARQPAPWREAVVGTEVAAADVALAASHVGGPLLLHAGTTVVAPEPDGVLLLPSAVQLSVPARAVLLLWRQGPVRGYQLVRGGKVLDAHVWDDAWTLVALDPELPGEAREELADALLPATGDAAALAARLAPEADVVALRTLLRRPPGPECLPDLCRALGLPDAGARLVEDGVLPDAAEPVAPASGPAAYLRAARAPRADDPWYLRMAHEKPWWYRLSDLVFAVLAALVAVGLWDGGLLARAGAVVLGLLAAYSVYDGVTPAKDPPRRG